jgi:membrane associated rhomboid family serine protease
MDTLSPDMATCYRHPNRETGVSCSNCGRPICPDCMTSTRVGMRCPECAKQRTKVVNMRSISTVPQVTYALIAINVIVFLAEGTGVFTLEGESTSSLIQKGGVLGSSPARGLAGEGVAHGQIYRIVTGGFLHENLLHIGFNMWVLYYLGMMLEPAIGRVRLLVVYGVSLLAGSLGALLVSPHSVTVGASGAIFGLMGAAAVEMRARQIPIMQSGVGGLILINLIISFTIPGISWGGHIGGLIGGAVAMLIFRVADRQRVPALAYAACAVIAVGSVAGSVATSHSTEVETVSFNPVQLESEGR